MLTYHQAFDLSHCMFRAITISSTINRSISVERYRVYDFYFVFPDEFHRRVSFPQSLSKMKKDVKFEINPYEEVSNAQSIFRRMKPYQDSALKNLASYGIISAEMLEQNILNIVKEKVPASIFAATLEIDDKQNQIIKVLETLSTSLEFRGKNGFLDRTSLTDKAHAR